MATLQLQKTRNAQTLNKTAIDQKQSLEVVQTMLHGSLSSLSYLRNFFAEKVFDEQLYDMSDKIHSYKDYAAGKLGKDHRKAAAPATVMRVLRRGRSRRVDMFLDWLEKGAFTALKAGNLRALQVYVHTDPQDRQKVVETYTFTIKYTQNAGKAKVPVGVEMDSLGDPRVSVEATNIALQTLLREVMRLCATLPDLPEKRFISMALFYVEDSKTEYQAKGFVPSTVDKLMFAQAEGWITRSKALPELGSLFHNSSLRVTYLQGLDANPSLARFSTPSKVPSALEYTTLSSRLSEMDTSGAAGAWVTPGGRLSTRRQPPRVTTPSTIFEAEKERGNNTLSGREHAAKPLIITPLPTSDAPFQTSARESSDDCQIQNTLPVVLKLRRGATQQSSILDTQSSNILGMRSALLGMMQPERVTQGDTQTQPQMPMDPPLPPRSESTETPSRYSVSPSKHSMAAQESTHDKPILSPTKAQHLDQEKQHLQQTAMELLRKSGRKLKKGDIVLCQCGHAEDEDEMVQCMYCLTWQHLHCYGYTGAHDLRLPDEHTCYQCLLGEREQLALRKLQDLALKRRAMHFALVNGLNTQRELASDLGIETGVANHLHQHLKSERYVVPATKSRQTGYRLTGKPLFVPVCKGPDHDRMLRELFDPLLHISHHYRLPPKTVTQPSNLTQRLLALQSTDMPPPATPASQLRKHRATTLATSGLEARNLLGGFQTPSRPRSRQVQPQQKRALAEEDTPEEAPSPKRRATPGSSTRHLRSLQSEFLLDAGGLPSSPFDAHTIR